MVIPDMIERCASCRVHSGALSAAVVWVKFAVLSSIARLALNEFSVVDWLAEPFRARFSSPCESTARRFLSGENVCEWHGVICNDDGHVVKIAVCKLRIHDGLAEQILNLFFLTRWPSLRTNSKTYKPSQWL